MKNILVTGGAGFIGSNFVKFMLEKHPEYKIINIDALTCGEPRESQRYDGNPLCSLKLILEIERRLKKFQENEITSVVNFAAEFMIEVSKNQKYF